MMSFERVLAISPHLDDAILSCGSFLGGMSNCGSAVTVATIFAGDDPPVLSPLAIRHHERCQLMDRAVDERRNEDAEACTHLNLMFEHGPFLDAVYRRDGTRWAYDDESQLFGTIRDNDNLVMAVRGYLQFLVNAIEPQLILFPLAVGRHVDHLITFKAARLVTEERSVALWLDVPYASDRDRVDHISSWHAFDKEPTEEKLRAAGCYASQVPMLWRTQQWYEELARIRERLYVTNISTADRISEYIRSIP